MRGDFTRLTFRPDKHYRAVRMQQGRVQLDADWNEQVDIEAHRSETTAADAIGSCGGPQGNAGFGLTEQDADLIVGAGRYYVDGILCQNEQDVSITGQPDLPGFVLPADPGLYLAYLDVWEREVTALDDPLIREVALGGPDTATRTKTVWQVKLLRVGEPVAPADGAPAPQPALTPEPTAPPTDGLPGGVILPGLRPGGLGSIGGLVDRLSTLAPGVTGETAAGPATTAPAPEATRIATLGDVARRAILAPGAGLAGRLHLGVGGSTAPAEPSAPPSGGVPHCGTDFPEWDELAAGAERTLAARAVPEAGSDDPCIVSAAAGYRRLENQLYRVEIHDPGPPGSATFKWSRDNGSVLTKWVAQSGNELTIGGIGRDQAGAFAGGQWIELTDDSHELAGTPGTLVRLSKVEGTTLTIDPDTAAGPTDRALFPAEPKVRRWDSAGPLAVQVAADDGWLPLEGGVQVRFDVRGAGFSAGDYWLIPARTVTGDVEWPTNGSSEPVALPPHGVRHHLCRLALAQLDVGGWTILTDCRSAFPAATDLTELSYVGGDGQEGVPDPAGGQALVGLPQPLRVGVSSGRWPVAGAVVRFLVVAGQGGLQPVVPGAATAEGVPAPVPALDVATGPDGLAACAWSLDPSTPTQQLAAMLLDPSGGVMHLPVLFSATLSAQAQAGVTLTLAGEGTETIEPSGQALVPASPLPAGLYSADISIADPPTPGSARRVSWQEEFVSTSLVIGPLDTGVATVGTVVATPVDVVHLPTEVLAGGPGVSVAGLPASTAFLGIAAAHPELVHVAAGELARAAAPAGAIASPLDVAHVAAATAGAAAVAGPVEVAHVDPSAVGEGGLGPAGSIDVAHVPADVAAGAGLTPIDVAHVSPIAPDVIGGAAGGLVHPIAIVGRQWRVTNVGRTTATVSYRIYRIPQP